MIGVRTWCTLLQIIYCRTCNVVLKILQGVPKKPKTIENDLLLEFQCLALS